MTGRPMPITSAAGVASTIMALGAFYLMTYLANRLSSATEQAELLLIELERTRAAEARAAGLAERVGMRLAYGPAFTRLVIEDLAAPVPVGLCGAGRAGGVAATDSPAGFDAARQDMTGADADSAGRPGTGGYALAGMRERAELLGGTLTTEATGTGYRVELEVPA
jgi:hypothetical protein